MAKKDKNIKEQTVPELKQALQKANAELFTLRMDKQMGKLKNGRSIFHKRKDIARTLTVIREKEEIA